MTKHVNPVVAWGPGSRLEGWWNERQPNPMATLRCGRGSKQCRRVLVEIHESPGGALVRFYQSVPATPVRVSLPPEMTSTEQSEAVDYMKGFDVETARGLAPGRRDTLGTLVALEHDADWVSVVEPSCYYHGQFPELTRHDLMEIVRGARRAGRKISKTLS